MEFRKRLRDHGGSDQHFTNRNAERHHNRNRLCFGCQRPSGLDRRFSFVPPGRSRDAKNFVSSIFLSGRGIIIRSHTCPAPQCRGQKVCARVRAVMPQQSSLNFNFTKLEVALMGRGPASAVWPGLSPDLGSAGRHAALPGAVRANVEPGPGFQAPDLDRRPLVRRAQRGRARGLARPQPSGPIRRPHCSFPCKSQGGGRPCCRSRYQPGAQ